MALPQETKHRARRLWQAGRYWEVHEVLEPFWLRAEGEERELLQGVIQLAAALHKAKRDRRAAKRIFARALRHLKRVSGLDACAFSAGVRRALEDPKVRPPFPLDET